MGKLNTISPNFLQQHLGKDDLAGRPYQDICRKHELNWHSRYSDGILKLLLSSNLNLLNSKLSRLSNVLFPLLFFLAGATVFLSLRISSPLL